MSGIFGSFWTVVVMAAVIAIVALLRGRMGGPLLLSLVVLLVVGALWPPLAVLVGGVALTWTVFTQFVPLLRQLGITK